MMDYMAALVQGTGCHAGGHLTRRKRSPNRLGVSLVLREGKAAPRPRANREELAPGGASAAMRWSDALRAGDAEAIRHPPTSQDAMPVVAEIMQE